MNIGGIFYAGLKINLDAGKALIINSKEKAYIEETKKLYYLLMKFTETAV